MIKMVGKIPWEGIEREWDRDVDKERNLRSQERIGLCSTNVETILFFLSVLLLRETEGRWGEGTHNTKFTDMVRGSWGVEDIFI